MTVFSVEKNASGAGNACPHCKAPVKVTVSIPALLLWLVPAIIVTVLLYQWLGKIATVLAGSAVILLSIRVRPVA